MANKAQPVKPVRFTTTKYKELRVVLDASAKKEVAGAVITKGLAGTFKDGLPHSVQFMEGEFVTSDPATINALKSHVNYGSSFISDDVKGEPVPTDEAVKQINAKKELAQEVRSNCPVCGKKFKNDFALQGHMRSHDK